MVEPVVDYSKVDAVNIKKTIAFVNNFAINTTQFLNRFSYICEQRLVWLGSGDFWRAMATNLGAERCFSKPIAP